MNVSVAQTALRPLPAADAPRRISWADLGREPFRVFFPAGVLAGVVGVLLWPLALWGLYETYPGQIHARIMTFGFFGAFIFGFLGTALPRMLSVAPLGLKTVLPLLGLFLVMLGAFTAGSLPWGDALFAALLLVFLSAIVLRARHRKDLPPPGFVLVGLAFAAVTAGTLLALLSHFRPEMHTFWIMLQRLLCSQGFVLLPVLGIGPFILPRLLGMPSSHDFPETLQPPAGWKRKFLLALSVGLAVIGSFILEAAGWIRTAYLLRFTAAAAYLLLEFPFRRAPRATSSIGFFLRLSLLMLVAGFLAVALFPAYRAGLLHLTLMGGFAAITCLVATRVAYGHSGQLQKLKGRNLWLILSLSAMLLAMLTRISGDLWPAIMASHYIYGALLWIAALLLWAAYVLPKTLQIEPE